MKPIFAGLAAASIACFAPESAQAQQLHQLHVPAGQLRLAVVALAQQADISIAIADPDLARIRVKAVRGRMTPEAALRRMLGGTGATFVALGHGDFRIIRVSRSVPRTRKPEVQAPEPPSPEPSPQDIIVTGSKRQLRLRNYPGPAVVIGGDDFEAGSAADGTGAISERIPSLGSTHLGPGRDKLFVRGISDSSFTGQTQATVGQYFGEARLNYNAPDPDLRLYDVASVELLPGPQGTLYGAGSMGGVLRVMPNAPDPAQASAVMTGSTAFTRHGEMSGELAGVVNLPVAERGGIRLVAYYLRDGGYIDDPSRQERNTNRARIGGGRLAGLWQLDGDWTVEAGGIIQSIEGDDAQYAERSDGDLAHSSPFAQPFSNDYRLAYATLRGDLGPYRLTSTISTADQDLVEDFAFRQPQPGLLRQHNRLSLWSAETRLSRTDEDGSGWIFGASLVRNRTHLTRASGSHGNWTPMSGLRNRLDEQTMFGEVSRRVVGPLILTAGARATQYSFAGKGEGAGMGEQAGNSSDWRLLPSMAASVDIGRGGVAYLRYQQSFRPGGIILRSTATQMVESDRIAAWEVGMRYGGGPIRASAAFSRTDWHNVQADIIDTVGEPLTINAGDGIIRTIETSIDWKPVRGLSVRAAATFNRSRLDSSRPGIITLHGDPLPNVPRAVARGELVYSRPVAPFGDMRLSASARYVGESRLGVGPILSRPQGEYWDANAEARIGRDDRFLFVRVTNLLDQLGNRFALGSVLTIVSEDQTTPLRPRTIKLGFQAAF